MQVDKHLKSRELVCNIYKHLKGSFDTKYCEHFFIKQDNWKCFVEINVLILTKEHSEIVIQK